MLPLYTQLVTYQVSVAHDFSETSCDTCMQMVRVNTEVWGMGYGVCMGYEVWGLGYGVWSIGYGI